MTSRIQDKMAHNMRQFAGGFRGMLTSYTSGSKLAQLFAASEACILNRSSLLSVILTVMIAFVAARVYQVWRTTPRDLPISSKAKPAPPSPSVDDESPQIQFVNTRNIVDKNLFDPERGAAKKQEEKDRVDAQARQRIRSMVLLGTAILGTSKYAILQDPAASRPAGQPNPRVPQPQQPASSGQMRMKLGDTIEGFRLADIRDKSVVFTKGSVKEEISIDFFRPPEPQTASPAPATPNITNPGQPQPRPGLAPRVGARVVPPVGDQTQPIPQDNSTAIERARRTLRERQLQAPQQPSGPAPQKAEPPTKAQ
jgi:hypothetical protein